MNAPPAWCRWEGPDLWLAVHVQPRAHQDAIVGPHGDRLKIRITAPPLEGRANSHLIRYLAECFAVPLGAVELLAGSGARDKRLRIHDPRCLPEGIPPRPAP
ncbi:MAG: DUF167 family protein [Gammaproteobacteria bacterium]